MAKTQLTKNTTTGNWELTETDQGQTYTNTLQTAGKAIEGDIKISITAKAGSVSVVNQTVASSSTSLNGTTLTVQATISPSVTAGYVSSGSSGVVKITGVVPTEIKTATPSAETQTITPSSGYLLSSVIVEPGGPSGELTQLTVSAATTYVPSSPYIGYDQVDVPSGGATASAEKGSVSNHQITVTPKVTKTAGWISAGTASGTGVTVSASELVSGALSITANANSITVTNYQYVNVNVAYEAYDGYYING